MGKDCRSWLHPQHLPPQPPDPDRSPAPDTRNQNIIPGHTYPNSSMISANGTLPGHAVSETALKTGQTNDLSGWFYCLPRHRQALYPGPNVVPKEKVSAVPCGFGGESRPNLGSGAVPNSFAVYDQSRNPSSLLFSSMFGAHAQCSTPKNQDLLNPYGSSPQDWGSKSKLEMINQSVNVISDDSDENQETDGASEMHEDTEELDALLYSEGDSDFDDDETSTGHYPGEEFIGHEKRALEESAEEVASSAGTCKRKRPLDEKQSLVDTASSTKPNGSWDYQDDADSSCVKGSAKIQKLEMDPSASNKRLKKERIREAVSILQSIIPGGKGKDAMFVLDEAIRYLRSMKAQS